MSERLQLIGHADSPFVRRAAITLKLYDLPFDHQARSAVITRYNPLGRVPVLVLPGEVAIIDSAMIVDYLDGVVGEERALIPRHGAKRAQINNVVAIAMGAAEKYVQAFYETTRRPAEKVWQPWLTQLEGQIGSALRVLDDVAGAPWFFGEALTHADVALLAAFQAMAFDMAHVVPTGRYSALEALSARAMELPAFSETYPAE